MRGCIGCSLGMRGLRLLRKGGLRCGAVSVEMSFPEVQQQMKNRHRYVRGFFYYSIATLISMPFSIGLPPLFWELSLKATRDSGFTGGMFHLPETGAEIFWSLCLLITSFPFSLLVLILSYPIAIVMYAIGVDFGYKIPFLTNLTVGGSILIAAFPALIIHVLFWGTWFYFIFRDLLGHLRKPRSPSNAA